MVSPKRGVEEDAVPTRGAASCQYTATVWYGGIALLLGAYTILVMYQWYQRWYQIG